MSEYIIGCLDIELHLQYEKMIYENDIDLSKYQYDDMHVPYILLTVDQQNDAYVSELYKKCIQECKPWQEYVQPVPYDENLVY